jgi:hypothetical protein
VRPHQSRHKARMSQQIAKLRQRGRETTGGFYHRPFQIPLRSGILPGDAAKCQPGHALHSCRMLTPSRPAVPHKAECRSQKRILKPRVDSVPLPLRGAGASRSLRFAHAWSQRPRKARHPIPAGRRMGFAWLCRSAAARERSANFPAPSRASGYAMRQNCSAEFPSVVITRRRDKPIAAAPSN